MDGVEVSGNQGLQKGVCNMYVVSDGPESKIIKLLDPTRHPIARVAHDSKNF